jgi:hypothetical protein
MGGASARESVVLQWVLPYGTFEPWRDAPRDEGWLDRPAPRQEPRAAAMAIAKQLPQLPTRSWLLGNGCEHVDPDPHRRALHR